MLAHDVNLGERGREESLDRQTVIKDRGKKPEVSWISKKDKISRGGGEVGSDQTRKENGC